MNNLPRLAHIIISILIVANVFLLGYAGGLNLKTVKLNAGQEKKSKLVRSSTYHAEDKELKTSDDASWSRSSAKSGSLSGKSAISEAKASSSSEPSSTVASASVVSSSGSTSAGSTSGSSSVTKSTSGSTISNTTAKNFDDLEKTEKRLVKSLKAAADAGVLDQSKDKLFHPNKPVTRADFTRWMVRIKQLPLVSETFSSYVDVKAVNPYFREIETATKAVMVQGYPIKGSTDKEFKPDQIITRQEFAAMYGTFSGKRARAEKLNAEKIDEYLQYDPDKSKVAKVGYKDEGQIDDWARKWVAVAQQAGVIEQAFDCNPGAKKEERRFLHPQKQMTRAESVNILVKLFGLSARRTVKSASPNMMEKVEKAPKPKPKPKPKKDSKAKTEKSNES